MSSCEQLQSGNVVFLDGTTSGDITFQQQCTANAKCLVDNNIQAVFDVAQELKQNNVTEASLFPNFGSINLNLADQEIRNQIESIISNSCTADVNQVQSNNMVYARNSSTGDISFLQEGNAVADCIISNAAIAEINMRQEGDQGNTISGSVLGGIIAAIIVIVIVVVIVRGATQAASGEQGQQQQRSGGGGSGRQATSSRAAPVQRTGTASSASGVGGAF